MHHLFENARIQFPDFFFLFVLRLGDVIYIFWWNEHFSAFILSFLIYCSRWTIVKNRFFFLFFWKQETNEGRKMKTCVGNFMFFLNGCRLSTFSHSFYEWNLKLSNVKRLNNFHRNLRELKKHSARKWKIELKLEGLRTVGLLRWKELRFVIIAF